MENFINRDIFFERFQKLPFVNQHGLDRLKMAKVLLVGAGGLGNPCAQALALSGIGQVDIIDHDRVELSNLQRQSLFTSDDVGRSKAQTLIKKLKNQVPEFRGESYSFKLSIENISELISNYDVVIDGTDDFMTKFILHDFTKEFGIPFLTASVYQTEGVMMFFNPQDKDSACLRCLYPQIPRRTSTKSCSEVGVWGVLVQIFGHFLASECVKFLLNLNPLPTGEQLTFDLMNLEMQRISFDKADHCSYCDKEELKLQNLRLKSIPVECQFHEEQHKTFSVLSAYEENLSQMISDPSMTYLLVCNTGKTAFEECLRLRLEGHRNVFIKKS